MYAKWPSMKEAIAKAYFDAALTEVDMSAAVATFQSIKAANLSEQHTVFDIYAAFVQQFGLAEPRFILPLVQRLRQSWQEAVADQMVQHVKAQFDRSKAEGWQAWLDLYSACFDTRAWWTSLAADLAVRALPASPDPQWPPQRIAEVTSQMVQRKWSETFDWQLYLAHQELSAARRAFFFVCCAEIEIYHFARPGRAREFLDEATKLDGGNPIVQRASGEYFQLIEDFAAARERFQGVIDARPDLADGYLGLGECHEQTAQLDLAETYYRQAIEVAPGSYDAHLQLLKLCVRPEWLPALDVLVERTFPRLEALSESPPQARLELGWVYHSTRRFSDARREFNAAAGPAPSDQSLVGHARCLLDESVGAADEVRKEALNQAREYLLEAWALRPTYAEIALGLASVIAEQGDTDEAHEWTRRAALCHPEWLPLARVQGANLLREAQRLDEAREDLNAALAAEPSSPHALSALADLADAYIDMGDSENAIPLLDRWRELKGESVEAVYQNRLGNLAYSNGDYLEAASHYRKAVSVEPKDAVMYSNLALALEEATQSGERGPRLREAVQALEKALEMDPSDDYKERLHAVQHELRFLSAYGEDVLKFIPEVILVRYQLRRELVWPFLNETHDALTPESLRRIGEMRDHLRQQYGLVIPGVRFSELSDGESAEDYRILIREREVIRGMVGAPAAQATVDSVLDLLSKVIADHLDRFVTYQEAFEFLDRAADRTEQIRASTDQVVRFAEVLRCLLRARVSIEPPDPILDAFVSADAATDPGVIAGAIGVAHSLQHPATHSSARPS